MKKHIANIITGCRVFGSALLLFFPVFSVQFYILYLFCSFTDMVDGTIARKTNSTSNFGSRFDTVADFVFVAASLIKILPAIQLPKFLWIWLSVIAIIKFSNIMMGIIYKKKLISLHTIMNKITGILLFLLPLTLHFIELKYSSVVVCSIATFSAIQEGYYIRIDRELLNIY
ncbi:MAG: CDP-alcohol phosphatidyltransferase family protein [Treponemataceae bacterium]|nr:CDP-alcohol phosphatidyltransferase family protein [Treponemataceae bacterium]